MASGQEMVRNARQSAVEDGEPLFSDTRTVQNNGGLECNLTEFGVSLHNISKGDEVTVAVFQDRIEIRPGDNDG